MAEGIPDGNLIDPVPSSVVQPHESLSIVLASTTSVEAEFNLENVKRYFDHKGVYLENTSLLHAAAGFGALQSVKYLIEQGVDVNITDETTGCIPLHNAVCHNHYEVAVYLIKHGASVDQGDKKGNTPTHSAAENINWNFYRLLLENGGDINKENADGVTPEALFQNQRQRLLQVQESQSEVAGSLSFTSENSSYSLNLYKVQNTDDDQRPSGTDLGLGLQQETLEGLKRTVKPDARCVKPKRKKGSKAKEGRNISRSQHHDKQKKTKGKKAVRCTRREKVLQRALDDNENFTTQYSPKTKRERMLLKKHKLVLHLKQSAKPNEWKIVGPDVNDGSHKPPETSTTPVPESSDIVKVENSPTGSRRNVTVRHIPSHLYMRTSDQPRAAMATMIQPIAEPSSAQGYSSGPNVVVAEQAESQSPHEDHSYPETPVSDKKQKMDAVKTEFRKIPDKKKKMFVVNLTKILQTCSIEQPDQNSGQTDEETLSAGQVVGGCNQLDQSLLPDFDKIDSENSKNSNFRSGIRNTICNYLKKDSNG